MTVDMTVDINQDGSHVSPWISIRTDLMYHRGYQSGRISCITVDITVDINQDGSHVSPWISPWISIRTDLVYQYFNHIALHQVQEENGMESTLSKNLAKCGILHCHAKLGSAYAWQRWGLRSSADANRGY